MKNYLPPEQIQIFLDALEKKIGKKLIFLDLDGTIANFEVGAEKWANDIGITAKEFIDAKMYRQPKFYLQLELISGAKEAIEKLSEKYEIRFLSAPSWETPSSFTEKRLWIDDKFGRWGKKRLDFSFRKDLCFGHYLVDDRTKYGAGDFMGEHIMYGSNKFQDWEKVTKYLL